jgi:molybdopterin-guanine dinucleotide biosynthesis protein A
VGENPLLENSAIVLAGGSSSRIGEDKGLVELSNKPLIKHVLEKTKNLVDEKIVVVHSKTQAEKYTHVLDSNVRVVIDKVDIRSPLAGAITGFESSSGEYSLLLSCDTPLVAKDILQLLLELCVNKSAVIPRWPNCYIEPLQAAYCNKMALKAAKDSLCTGNLKLQGMIDRLRNVRYVSTLVLEQLDPDLTTFFNVNTALDLKRAAALLNSRHAV